MDTGATGRDVSPAGRGPACGFKRAWSYRHRRPKASVFQGVSGTPSDVLDVDNARQRLDRPPRGGRDRPAAGHCELTFPAAFQLEHQPEPPLAPSAALHDL